MYQDDLSAAAGSAATGVAGTAGAVAIVAVAAIFQGILGEDWQAEELVADVVGELLAGRNGAEAVRGNHDLDVCNYLKYNRHANGELELVVTDVFAGDADCADQTVDAEGNDGVIGDEQQHVALDGDHTTGDAFTAVAVCEEDVDGDIDVSTDSGEVGAIAQAVDGQVAQVALYG